MSEILKTFEAMVADLARHPRVALTCAHIGQPVSASALRAAERRLGARLPRPIGRLYQACNGLQLRWRLGPPRGDREPPRPVEQIGLIDDDACINLLPVEELQPFVPYADPHDPQADDSPVMVVAGRQWSESALLASLYPLNRFSDYAFAGLLRGPRRFAPMVVPVSAFGQRIHPPWDCDGYLERLLATGGLLTIQNLDAPWPDGLPERWTARASLDRLVALAEESAA